MNVFCVHTHLYHYHNRVGKTLRKHVHYLPQYTSTQHHRIFFFPNTQKHIQTMVTFRFLGIHKPPQLDRVSPSALPTTIHLRIHTKKNRFVFFCVPPSPSPFSLPSVILCECLSEDTVLEFGGVWFYYPEAAVWEAKAQDDPVGEGEDTGGNKAAQ